MPVNGAQLAEVVYPLLVKIAELSAEGSRVLPQLCPNSKRTILVKKLKINQRRANNGNESFRYGSEK